MFTTKDSVEESALFDLLNRLEFTSEQKKMYKIGAKVRSKSNGQDYYVVGLKTIPSTVTYGHPIKQLIVHTHEGVPSRMGFPVYLDQMLYVGES